MANIKSAQKRIKQIKVKTERNRYYKTKMKNITKKFLEAVEAKDKDKITETFKIVNKDFQKMASKGVLKKKTAARKISRLYAQAKPVLEAN